MALRSDWSARNCSMARGLDILGDPWGMLVLREIFFGNGRFDAIKARLEAADSVLTKRLAALVDAGLLTRRPYDDGGRTRQEYVLTDKGEDALPVLNAVVLWAEKHLPAPSEQAHMLVIHSGCGAATSSADTCTACGARITADNTSWHSLTRTTEPVPLATSPRTSSKAPSQHGTAA
ncbi:DNA-binding HxlR family transcriptional regulator [Arthrobacter sp. V4I6]|uniref:winged helix-turn-helix transcriptional regulator n=1 Tax=unclassified Arthrobacter TaxID=235627 RepID=UPI002780B620|nr:MULTISPECIES: helix-turn-helix domain-containing protein [unclassified Arthrobacter]MDQ0819883.1 DNA-binding HxlR family transcriptional regulator [Arthrobacter sp. V1I7]MDQ0854064.1 DNA-binding HxlR family transcriptional regulator [Arthrobacter sp. V4I6]